MNYKDEQIGRVIFNTLNDIFLDNKDLLVDKIKEVNKEKVSLTNDQLENLAYQLFNSEVMNCLIHDSKVSGFNLKNEYNHRVDKVLTNELGRYWDNGDVDVEYQACVTVNDYENDEYRDLVIVLDKN
jgi:hypothetical protein